MTDTIYECPFCDETSPYLMIIKTHIRCEHPDRLQEYEDEVNLFDPTPQTR